MSDSTTLNQPAAPDATGDEAFAARAIEGAPQWFAERRQAGRDTFTRLPMPTAKDESWRFASVGRLSIDGFHLADPPDEATARSILDRSSLVSERAGQMVFADDHRIGFERADDSLAAQGVVYLPLEEALRERPDLLERYLLKESTDLGSQKFLGLHAALVRAGSVLYVPENVEIEAPFVNYYWTSAEGSAVFPHTLVIAGDNAKVSTVDVFFSAGDDNSALNCAVCDLHGGPASKVFRKVVQDWNAQTTSFQIENSVADKDADIKNLAVNIGASRARYENQTRVEGSGANVKMYSLTVAEERQEFDQRTLQTHVAPNSTSDLLYKNALLDRSRTIFSGLIKVVEEAQQTDAYQTNRNLLLDPSAEANALPGLEILANDVACSHGATTGHVSEEELFYLLSRGISHRTAMQLMVFGFFEEIIEKVESEELAENLRELIRKKFESKIRSTSDDEDA